MRRTHARSASHAEARVTTTGVAARAVSPSRGMSWDELSGEKSARRRKPRKLEYCNASRTLDAACRQILAAPARPRSMMSCSAWRCWSRSEAHAAPPSTGLQVRRNASGAGGCRLLRPNRRHRANAHCAAFAAGAAGRGEFRARVCGTPAGPAARCCSGAGRHHQRLRCGHRQTNTKTGNQPPGLGQDPARRPSRDLWIGANQEIRRDQVGNGITARCTSSGPRRRRSRPRNISTSAPTRCSISIMASRAVNTSWHPGRSNHQWRHRRRRVGPRRRQHRPRPTPPVRSGARSSAPATSR